MTRPLNHMRMFLAPDELRPFVVDWPDVAAALMARARHEAMAAPLDLALQSTWRELLKLPDVTAPQFNEGDAPGPLCEVRLQEGRHQHRPDRRGADAGNAAGRHAAGIARGNVHAGGRRLRGRAHGARALRTPEPGLRAARRSWPAALRRTRPCDRSGLPSSARRHWRRHACASGSGSSHLPADGRNTG